MRGLTEKRDKRPRTLQRGRRSCALIVFYFEAEPRNLFVGAVDFRNKSRNLSGSDLFALQEIYLKYQTRICDVCRSRARLSSLSASYASIQKAYTGRYSLFALLQKLALSSLLNVELARANRKTTVNSSFRCSFDGLVAFNGSAAQK